MPHPPHSAHLAARPGWSELSSDRAHDGAHVKVDQVTVQTPGRPEKPAKWTVVRRKPAVGIAAYDAEGRWMLIKQERIPVMQELWEFPAGQVDAGHAADAEVLRQRVEDTVHNELREEAGLRILPGGSLHHVGHVYLSPGFTDEVCYLVIAGPVEQSSAMAAVGGEVITEHRWCSMDDLHQMVAENQLTNGLSLALYAHVLHRSLKSGA